MYQLYINTMSPFSRKSSAMIGYAGLPCELRVQNLVNRVATLKRLTGQAMVPTLRRGEWTMLDSSHIARFVMEKTDRPLLPRDEALEPICWILEDFADEWVSLWVLSFRWLNEEDKREIGEDVGREITMNLPLIGKPLGRLAAQGIAKVMRSRGGRESNRRAFERSRDRLLQAFETILEESPEYLFERYPTVADFAFFGQLDQYAAAPTSREKMLIYPNLSEYIGRMDAMALPHPSIAAHEGQSRPLSALSPLLAEFLGTYWRVLVANHRCRTETPSAKKFEVELLDGEVFESRPSRYLVGRLQFVLSQLDEAYSERDELFGGKGLEIEQALVEQVARLTDYPAGRELLRQFPHIAKS